ncbi:MAG: alanine--tRNA ligase [Candidatus Dormibacteraeota bacterium]|nr:alanine--tRNA ligase [Candidatus Dormibacteraeota bacterium]MBV9526326.1 alanine--tRNA ligase [Candidatus Dormibacteraeota bacterium]
MRSHDIRERYLRFFEERGHHRLPSSSLIPRDDPSLLFTVAGMVPLKPFIAGRRTPPAPNLTSCQKCFRGAGLKYDDIASVGDAYHHTFFEMLGNWSIGQYFKERAIEYAWELSTDVFGLDPTRIWPSVYPDDEESERIWTERIGVPRERIARMEDNWWAAGPTGPCGYDSELYWDFGLPCSCGRSDCTPADECGGDRWCEYWNLVFMEFDQQEDGSRPRLPKPTVDTGMGLERMTSVLQGVRNDYENDLFVPLVASFRERARADTSAPERLRSIRVLADHLRGACFLVADGVIPSNEGRGYVLRRLVRRAAVHARAVSLEGGMTESVPVLVEEMAPVYPELREHQGLIEHSLREEEAMFRRTLDAAMSRLDSMLAGGTTNVSGIDAFRLYDTFGLPVELTVEMAAERGAVVDLAGFRSAMDQQRAQSRAAVERTGFGAAAVPATRFVGYEEQEADASVLAVEGGASLHEGDSGGVVLDVSPFYAEAGGQVGDTGRLSWAGGEADVLDTQQIPGSDSRVHRVRVTRGDLIAGTRVNAEVDRARRAQLARHHSATHLLNRALREVLGESILQRGSLVAPDHTTFDFSFSRALTPDELAEIEHRVNEGIRRNLERSVEVMPLAAARASGAIALIDEQYAEDVRVIDFGGWSRELCGGTHVQRSGDIGAALIVSESSIGQGVRRIDMVAGEAAEQRWHAWSDALHTTARALRAKPEEVPERVAALQEQLRRAAREADQARRRAATGGGVSGASVEEVGGLRLASVMLDAESDGDGAVAAADLLYAERLQGDGVAVALAPTTLAVKVGGRAIDAGIDAGALVRAASEVTGARGGGRREFARGGIKDAAKRGDALDVIRASLSRVGTAS